MSWLYFPLLFPGEHREAGIVFFLTSWGLATIKTGWRVNLGGYCPEAVGGAAEVGRWFPDLCARIDGKTV